MKKNGSVRIGFYVLWMVMALSTRAFADWEDCPGVEKIFKNAGVEGTFVLYDVTAQKLIGHDRKRAYKRYVPASTFKIPNSLIGLSVGSVKSVDDVLPYKSDAPPFSKDWEKDMSLRAAIVLSNVPIYQELARRIGLDRMQENIAKLNYGNLAIGNLVDTFWLNGPLEISAVEQARFLAGLAKGALPFPLSCQKSVREIVFLDQGENGKLYGKTGWQNAPNPGVGWWVGWVEKEDRVYAFALNMDIQTPADAEKRVVLGREALKFLKIR